MYAREGPAAAALRVFSCVKLRRNALAVAQSTKMANRGCPLSHGAPVAGDVARGGRPNTLKWTSPRPPDPPTRTHELSASQYPAANGRRSPSPMKDPALTHEKC